MNGNNKSALDTRPKDEKRSKYRDNELHVLRNSMLKNMFARESPMMNDQVNIRGLDKKWVYHPVTGKPIQAQKQLICVDPGGLYKLMLMPVNDGGYSRSRDPKDNICYSKSTLIKYWPNWLVPMTARYKYICGCECCTISQEMQENLNNTRHKALKDLKELLSVTCLFCGGHVVDL